jgi:membrane associated rhomboid family serine protease
MIAWERASDAERPWATWVLLGAFVLVQLGAGGSEAWRAELGLLPADPRLAALVGHLFLHAGASSLLATLLFAAVTGPWLEARIGRGLLLASHFGAGLAGAALFAVLRPDVEEPWLGASAAVAGWLGLAAVAARGGRADLLGVAAGRAGRLLAPGWAPAALWLGGELAGLVTGDAAALLADAGGFAFGAGLAFAFERTGLVAPPEERAAPAAKPRARAAAPAVRGTPVRPEALEAQLGEAADPAIARAYLAHARSEGRGATACAVVSERLREALEARRREPAVALLGALAGAGAAPDLPAETLLELSSWARAAGQTYEANAALHAALRGADPAGAARIARAARRSDPVLSYRAAERALENGGLGGSERSALEGLRLEAGREIGARGVIVVPGSAPPPAPPPPARAETAVRVTAPGPARALALGEAIELAPEPELAPPPPALPDPERSGEDAFLDAFHAALHEEKPEPDAKPLRALRVREAAPRALEAGALVLEVPGRGAVRLPLTRIHAVALVGVRGISERAGDKPVLLVDLCLSAEGEPELQVLRLRSDRFDPRRVAPGAEPSPLKALRAFVAALAAAAHAPLLPADDVAGEGPLRIFRDLATYQREVLGAV